jgi:hypothetical protein
MPAKAGIQKRFPEALDSRLRGNDNMIEGNAIFVAPGSCSFRTRQFSCGCEPADRPLDRELKP